MSKAEPPLKKSHGGKIAALVSMILWILGFALAFVFPTGSPWIWVPDALLLAGFFPLLFAWKPGWPWVVFGLLNVVIGFFLLVAFYMQSNQFTPEMVAVRNHLAEKHSPFTWMFFGVVSTIYGAIRMIKNLIIFIKKKSAQAKQVTNASKPE